MCGIYKITNLINGKVYIGQSIDIKRRWREEKNGSKNPNSNAYDYPLQRGFRKYGIENFSFEVIEECDKDILSEKEIYYIDLYNSCLEGYNQTLGGESASNPKKLSEAQVIEIYELLEKSDMKIGEIASLYSVGIDVISTINHGKSRRHPGMKYPIRSNISEDNFCCDCGKKIDPKAKRCIDCSHRLLYRTEHPDKDTLYQILLENKGNFTKVGKLYNVRDNTIRKWCKKYDLPFHSIDYK